jgi:xylulokinase
VAGSLLGIDVGSSSVKVSLVDVDSGRVLTHATSPTTEMAIQADRPGWAEQHPDLWWEHACRAIQTVRTARPKELATLKGIGIAYQMHGLVLVDAQGQPVRPSIIWCDSRAVELGAQAFKKIGQDECLSRFGNSPGNFTAAKLAWVKQNEPDVLARAVYMMLPGDYIAFKLTGRFGTTPSGLSEGILWDFKDKKPAVAVLEQFGLSPSFIPPVTDNVGPFAELSPEVASELGLPKGVAVSYRAGDQPNNALALNVLNPGEIAANAGTSGVVYGVTADLGVDRESRVNNFLHVNSSDDVQRVGMLMCVNGAGSFYRWMRQTFAPSIGYQELNALAASAAIGARGVVAIPYGNGAERTLGNKSPGASIEGLELNIHEAKDLFRAAQEGIVFALNYGIEIMRSMGLTPHRVRAGFANMFQSPLFQQTFATTTGVPLELYTTDGAEGAARAAGIGCGLFSYSDAFKGLQREAVIEPNSATRPEVLEAYGRWKEVVRRHLA